MKFKFLHNNLNVLDLNKSLEFYKTALGLREVRRIDAGDFVLVFMDDGTSAHQLELTWIKERTDPYELGDNEVHLAFQVDDYAAAYALHEKMNCICYDNPALRLYFISDPDGYWIEIIPA
ncbi:MAG: VOC family protein [Negativicutes bacterium]|jgi:lactoylglutathione lyase